MTVGSGVAVVPVVVVFLNSAVRVAIAWTGSTIMAAVVCGVRVLLTVLMGESEVKGRGALER
jgi:hypothetical protein